MDPIHDQDILQSIDIDDLGICPLSWSDDNKELDDSTIDYFGTEKLVDFNVYSAEIQTVNDGKKITSDEDDSSMMDDDDSSEFDIDPETGEKIFRESTDSASNSYSSTSQDKWIEQFLSKFEASTHQFSPNEATTADNSTLLFENITGSFLENFDEETDPNWLSSIFDLEETSEKNMFANPIIPIQSIDNNENTVNEIAISSNESTSMNSFSIFNDDEYSNYSEITLDDTKSERVEADGDSLRPITLRRASIRSNNQRQLDEEALNQHNIPLTVNDITHSNTDEYNRHIARLSYLSTEQMNIIKDIRRRGKNKIAAQNCRKRKATSVESLGEEVEALKRVKHELEERKKAILQQITETRNQYEYLHQQVLPDRQLPPAITVK
ncbi:unnamed protein product [Rotaria magnacalcarata]|uniref:BZIP domain-containing protein n=2 Tax=Rotaria magnacalcarata TaxID=392030 RepID=A0A816LZE3_9BILA|nr:unnamed protein product [Rotaria magnacalcarata]CAF1365147.1 unnamed protein product [Rotaria magnacalcarata]CAF1964373.1 unnamed protein product [Rotaria magnacalcarata]CAF3881098.1 unnamed protein product [Rotaria magnacalcarata]CAF4017446.1 unnamed protein product [Rotaria magnacalcarata]